MRATHSVALFLNQNFMETFDINEHLYALQQRNLVYNHDFRYFNNKTESGYGTPDGWYYDDKGANGSITFDKSTECCTIKKSGGTGLMTFKQALHEFPRWKQML